MIQTYMNKKNHPNGRSCTRGHDSNWWREYPTHRADSCSRPTYFNILFAWKLRDLLSQLIFFKPIREFLDLKNSKSKPKHVLDVLTPCNNIVSRNIFFFSEEKRAVWIWRQP